MHVFEAFDVHKSGAIKPGQLLQLGRMRRSLGHRAGVWDEAKNNKLIWKMDSDADGKISADEFCWYFEAVLARDMNEFDAVVPQFLQVARQLNKGACPLLPAHPLCLWRLIDTTDRYGQVKRQLAASGWVKRQLAARVTPPCQVQVHHRPTSCLPNWTS